MKKVRKYKPDQMAITPVSKSNAKPFKVQNMVKDINDEPETIEALVQDIQVAPDGTELFDTNGLYDNVEDDIPYFLK